MIRPVLLALPILLGGCSTYYPPLYSSPSIAASSAATGTLKTKCETKDESDPPAQTLACAEILQAIYSDGYSESAQLQDISQLPIIGAAAAASWILLKNKDGAARKVGKIGIGALTYSAARDQLFPKDLPGYFITGHGALGCVLAEGDYFSGTTARNTEKNLAAEVSQAYMLRVAVQKLRYLDPAAGDTSATPEMLAAARTLADQAITLSAAQLETSQAQLGAFQFANSHFRRGVTDIAAWVASRGRSSRPNLSYDTLLGTFKPTESAPGVTEEGTTPSTTGDQGEATLLRDANRTGWTGSQLVERLATASSILTNATIRLKGATPDYKGRLEAVRKCATDLPAS
jgi:hypothetical protein